MGRLDAAVAAWLPVASAFVYSAGLLLQRVRRQVPRSFVLAAGTWAMAALFEAWWAARRPVGPWGEGLAVLLAAAGAALDWAALLTLRKAGGLVTDGVYRLSRHPQHLGVLLLLAGPFAWPLPPLGALVGVTVWKWLADAARIEERELLANPGTREAYKAYMRRVPFGVNRRSVLSFPRGGKAIWPTGRRGTG